MRRPLQPFTVAFIGICIVTGALDFFTSLSAWGEMSAVKKAGAMYGPLVAEGEWWRVLSTTVLHAGVIHLGMNMMATYDLGGQLERAIGAGRMALITAITGVGASTMVLLFSYYNVTVGASGIICGYVGAMLPIATHEGRRVLTSLVIQIAIISLLPFVSWQGHLGGFLAGLLCGVLLKFFGRKFYAPGAALLALTIGGAFFAVQLHGALSRMPPGMAP